MRIFGMSAEDREASTSSLADTKQAGAKRRRWPDALKRELVAATTEPGASVSVIARRHDVNANQLFKWCRQLGGLAAAASVGPAHFVPVEIAPVPATTSPTQAPATRGAGSLQLSAAPSPAAASGTIEIQLPGGVRVKIIGAADARSVSAVLGAVMAKRRRR
jgi:transposase